MTTYHFSPSSLGLLKDCPRCFWLHFNKNIRRPNGPFPSLPSGMDRVLKAHFDSFARKGALPPELKELEGSCTLFPDLKKLDEWRNNFKGVRYQAQDFSLSGAVDNLLVSNGDLIVLDYKTRGYPLKDDTHLHYTDQLDLYNFLLRKNNQKTADYSYLLFYHPEKVEPGGSVIFNTNLVKIPVKPERAEEILEKAVETLSGGMPKPAEGCVFCGWVESCTNCTF